MKGKCFKRKQKFEFLNWFELSEMEFFLAVVAVDRDRDKKSRPRDDRDRDRDRNRDRGTATAIKALGKIDTRKV